MPWFLSLGEGERFGHIEYGGKLASAAAYVSVAKVNRSNEKRFGVQGPFLKRPWQVQGGALVAPAGAKSLGT